MGYHGIELVKSNIKKRCCEIFIIKFKIVLMQTCIFYFLYFVVLFDLNGGGGGADYCERTAEACSRSSSNRSSK